MRVQSDIVISASQMGTALVQVKATPLGLGHVQKKNDFYDEMATRYETILTYCIFPLLSTVTI